MPQKLGLAPRGITSLFNLQAFGTQPGLLEDAIRPGVDITPFMLADKIFHARNSATITARGQACLVTVPAGELWRPIVAVSYWAGATTAGDVLNTCFVLDNFANQAGLTTSGVPISSITDWKAAVSVGDLFTDALWFDSWWFLHAGTQIGLRALEYLPVGAGNAVSFEMLYHKFTV